MAGNDKPRVLVLDRFFFPDEQATAIYLTELVTALSEKFEFEVICGSPAVVTENIVHPLPRLKVYEIPCSALPKSFLWARALNDLIFLVLSFLRGIFFLRRPDMVISQTSPPAVWWVGFLISRWHQARWIQVLQDIFPDNLRCLNGYRKTALTSFLERLCSFPLRKTHKIVVVGQDMKKKLLKKGFPEQQITFIQNWTDPNFIYCHSGDNFVREKYGLEDKFVVLYAGNFGRIYNFEDLLDAAEALKSCHEVVFLLVGEGALKETVLEECRRHGLTNVLIAPFEPRTKLPEVLGAADVSIVLLQKGMAGFSVPSKIYSILASGRPTIACLEEESDIARIVRESNSGFVVPLGNPQEFAGVIRLLYENPELKEQLGRNARRYAETQDFKGKALRDYERVFSEVLNQN